MEVPLNQETEVRLKQLAADAGRDAEQFAADLLQRFIEEDRRFREAVQRGIDQADRGEFLEEEEMDARMASWFAS